MSIHFVWREPKGTLFLTFMKVHCYSITWQDPSYSNHLLEAHMNITDHRLLGVNGAGKTTTMRMITGRKGVVRLMTQNRSRAQQGSRAGVVGKPFTGDTEVTKGDVLVGGASVQAGWSRSWEDVEKWFVGCSFCLTLWQLGKMIQRLIFLSNMFIYFQPGVKPAAGFPVGLFIYIFISIYCFI